MKLQEINKEKTPELFYSKLVDNIWVETESMNITGGIQLRKRCLKGWQDILLRYGALKLYFVPEKEDKTPDESNAKLVADGILIPQKKVNGEWVNMTFSVDDISSFTANDPMLEDLQMDVDKDAYSVFDNGVDSIVVDFKWRIGDSKQTYRIESDIGTVVRMAAIVNDYKEDGVDVKQDFSDFLGLTLTETLTEQDDLLSTKYIFESEGKELTELEPSFEVDPYLEVDEQTNDIDITCDGYVVRFNKTIDAIIDLMDPTKTTIWAEDSGISMYPTSDSAYYLRYDENRSTTILVNTPTVVKILIKGKLDKTWSGTTYLTGVDSVEALYTVYPDRIFVDYVFVLSSTVTLDSQVTNRIATLGGITANITNEANITGTLTETNPASQYVTGNTDNYLGYVSDEIDVIGITLNNVHTGTSTYGKTSWGYAQTQARMNDGTVLAGTHKFSFVWIIDSAEREGGKLYDGSQLVAANVKVDEDGSSASNFTTIGSHGIVSSGGAFHGADAWYTCGAYHNTSLGDPDHWVQGAITGQTINGSGLYLRYDTASDNGYLAEMTNNSSLKIYKVISGALTQIGITSANLGGTDGSILKVKIVGSTIQVYLDGVLIQIVTDTTHSTGNYCGVFIDRSNNQDPTIDDFQAGVFSATTRLQQGDQYKDTTLALTTGLAITAGTGTTSIGSSGFNADGGWHLTSSDGSGTTKYTNDDKPRHKKVDAIHNFPIQSGDPENPTDRSNDLTEFYLKGDDDTLTAPDIGTATGFSINSTVSLDTGAAPDGSDALDISTKTNATGYPINIDSADIPSTIGTIEIKIKPHYSGTPSLQQTFLYDDIGCNHQSSGRLYFNCGGRDQFTYNWIPVSGQWYTFRWNYTNSGFTFYIDDIPISTVTGSGTLSNIYVGRAWQVGSATMMFSLCDFYMWDNPFGKVLPYGAHFVGNGSVNAAVAHKGIKTYLDCESNSATSPNIGTSTNFKINGSPSVVSGINGNGLELNGTTKYVELDYSDIGSEGSISGWILTGSSNWADGSTTRRIFDALNGSNLFRFHYSGAAFNYFYGTTGYVGYTFDAEDSTKYHFKATFSAERMELFIDGISVGSDISLGSLPTGHTVMRFGLSEYSSFMLMGVIDEIFITSDPNTPQIPTANGIPLHIPLKGDA